ncbi:MAG: SHOCT domain-containing protein [Bacillota bacterium]
MFGGFYGNFFWGVSMLLHMLIPVLLIILAVTVGIRLWDRVAKKDNSRHGGPVAALKERYARGEISREEFFKVKEELTQF